MIASIIHPLVQTQVIINLKHGWNQVSENLKFSLKPESNKWQESNFAFKIKHGSKICSNVHKYILLKCAMNPFTFKLLDPILVPSKYSYSPGYLSCYFYWVYLRSMRSSWRGLPQRNLDRGNHFNYNTSVQYILSFSKSTTNED